MDNIRSPSQEIASPFDYREHSDSNQPSVLSINSNDDYGPPNRRFRFDVPNVIPAMLPPSEIRSILIRLLNLVFALSLETENTGTLGQKKSKNLYF